eukprot:g4974.t1
MVFTAQVTLSNARAVRRQSPLEVGGMSVSGATRTGFRVHVWSRAGAVHESNGGAAEDARKLLRAARFWAVSWLGAEPAENDNKDAKAIPGTTAGRMPDVALAGVFAAWVQVPCFEQAERTAAALDAGPACRGSNTLALDFATGTGARSVGGAAALAVSFAADRHDEPLYAGGSHVTYQYERGAAFRSFATFDRAAVDTARASLAGVQGLGGIVASVGGGSGATVYGGGGSAARSGRGTDVDAALARSRGWHVAVIVLPTEKHENAATARPKSVRRQQSPKAVARAASDKWALSV